MIDFPITELLDESICTLWLERYLHPNGVSCPHCASPARRFFREQGYVPAYRCRTCHGYDTRLTGTVFEQTRQRPATLVLLLRGMAKGEPTARLARERGCPGNSSIPCGSVCKPTCMRPRQPRRGVASPVRRMRCSSMRGKQGTPHRHPSDPPRRRAHKRKGHGT
jgi:hypothetical protein